MAFRQRQDESPIYDHLKLVHRINNYAMLMGYLSMAIKGLGFLVLTWTTVVLLGGFVSILPKNDFWSLTFITLVQTARIFDVDQKEKLSNVPHAIFGLLESVFRSVEGGSDYFWVAVTRFLLACILTLVQSVVLLAVLCPLAIIYEFGILMSGGISVWRLKEHDYRGSDEETSNLPSAMDTLYYLALIQCVLFCSWYVLGLTEKRFAFGNYLEEQVFSIYLRYTKKRCEKDPSFKVGKNLTTPAIDMISSKSRYDCIDGVKMLYTYICMLEREMEILMQTNNMSEYHLFEMKQLVSAATSSGKVLQKLLEMLNPKGLHGRETRKYAAKIVERLASDINLEQLPRGIHYISSLIGTLQEYNVAHPFQPGWVSRDEHVQAYKELLLRGLCIIWELASSENNCRVISDTQNLVSKIMAPVASDLLHHTFDDHGEWSNIVDISLEVISRLCGAPGETGAKLRREISSCKEAISTLERRIISCDVCKKELKEKAIQILTLLYMDSESSRSANFILRKKEFIRMVLDIFTDGRKSLHVRTYAGAALSGFHGGGNATIVMQTSADTIKGLTRVLLDDEEDMVLRGHAAVILEHLWTCYTEHDNYLSVFKTEMSIAVGKVIKEITDTGKDILADIENQNDNRLGKGIAPSCFPSHWKNDEQDKREDMHSRLLSSLLSLCGMVYNKLVSEGSVLTPQFDNASIFLNTLKNIVVRKGYHPTVANHSLFKAVAKMVISMMKHSSGRFVVEEREGLQSLIEALSRASKNMLDLDYSMIFSSTSRFEATAELDKCTLASLVKEAQDSYATLPSTSGRV